MSGCKPSVMCGRSDCDFCSAYLLAGLRSGAWLDAQTFPTLRYHVPCLVPEGLTLNVGPPKVGKSWMVLDYSLAIAAGGRVFGSVPVDARPVLYLALEDGDRRLQDRARKLLDGAAIPSAFEYMTRVQAGRVVETLRAWLDRHRDAAPFVVLDTLGKVMPPALMGESSYQRDYRVGSALKLLVDEHPGSALVLNHHDRKAATDDFVQSVSGTNGLAGAADTIIVLSRRRHEAEAVVNVTGRDVVEGEYGLVLQHGYRWLLDGADFARAAASVSQRRTTEALGDRSAAIVGYARNQSPKTITAAEVGTRYDISTDDAGRYLRRLVDAGRLVKRGRGTYAYPAGASELSEVSETRGNVVDLFGQTDTSDTVGVEP